MKPAGEAGPMAVHVKLSATPSGAAAPPKAERHRARRWIPWSGAALLVALIVAGLWPKPVPVEIVRVAAGPLRATVDEEGKTRIRQRFMVSAPVTGQLRRIPLKPGAAVEAGQTVVAVIDPLSPVPLDARSRALAEARRDTASAQCDKARTALGFAASDLKRFEKLYAERTVSIQELEAVQWREAAATRDLAAAQSALRQAEAELAEFAAVRSDGGAIPARPPIEVKAPASGRILRVVEESARVVAAGAPLLEIGDPTDLEVVIEVLSRDGAALAAGTKIELDQWGGAAPLQARVRLVEPAAFTKVSALGVEEQRVRVIADLVTPPADRASLGDNFRVDARIIVWEADGALKVPSGALFRRGQDWAAFVVADGRAHLRPVKPGRASATETEVLDGLRAGEAVVLYPGDRIRDGQRVQPISI